MKVAKYCLRTKWMLPKHKNAPTEIDCTNCGQYNSVHVKFCGNCAQSIRNPTAAQGMDMKYAGLRQLAGTLIVI